ncbi:MAG TPA: PilT/PilU family type 4a pilus ATPase [Sandaracinaceae bacterium LLY-WYZ-13_1]|nr:PilT/PilU family type 4a pilus ATPase [Sandaracinaceae bacterium LLY-WYZ-13_1]
MEESALHALLKKGQQYAASDILLKVGQPPAFRVGGTLHYLQGDKLKPDQTRDLARAVLAGSRYRGTVDELQQYDTAYSVPGVGRYRVNVYRQRGTLALALRAIPLRIPTFEELRVPPVVRKLAELERGMVLICGAAGNGKSSTLASMIGHLNQARRSHVVTIEDPIEFIHQDGTSLISQREVGIDTEGFATALRAALRQSPDAILVGEIRDDETMDIGLKAAETGHLVLSTLHTPDVTRTVGRILALMGEREATETRERLADNLKGIVAQRLLPRGDGQGLILAAEVLVVTGTARETIRKPEGNLPLKDIMERGRHPYGMQTFEMHLRELVKEGLVEVEVARQALS